MVSQELLNSAKDAIEQAKAKGKTKFYALISGGKDSISAAHVAMKFVKLEGVIMVDTTIGLKDTYDHVAKIAKQFNLPLIVLTPKMTYEMMINKYGFPHPSQHRMAFIYLKWKPIAAWLKTQANDVCLISGVRIKESRRRMANVISKVTQDKSCKKMFFVAPLYDWSTVDVWSYLKENNLEVSPVYATLHLSGDCLCGAYAQAGEAEMIKLFYPDMAERISLLEKKCCNKYNKWGNGSSMSGSLSQSNMEDYICTDCQIGKDDNDSISNMAGIIGGRL